MISSNESISFRPLDRSDFALVARWFTEPQVARWWSEDSSLEHLEAKYGPRVDGRDHTSMWIIEVDGEPAGLAQHYRHEHYPDHDAAVGIPDAVGIDYLLSEDHAGRGHGPGMLATLARLALDAVSEARCCVASPAQDNRPSWTALERAGFHRHGPCHPPGDPPCWAYVLERDAIVTGDPTVS